MLKWMVLNFIPIACKRNFVPDAIHIGIQCIRRNIVTTSRDIRIHEVLFLLYVQTNVTNEGIIASLFEWCIWKKYKYIQKGGSDNGSICNQIFSFLIYLCHKMSDPQLILINCFNLSGYKKSLIRNFVENNGQLICYNKFVRFLFVVVVFLEEIALGREKGPRESKRQWHKPYTRTNSLKM